jgi:hypothetical protein
LPHDLLAPWHDFFGIVGTAAATLVGLMFVAASVGSGVFTEERQVGLRTLLSPTVVAFSVVLAMSVVGVLPLPNWGVPCALVGGIGALGLAYSGMILRKMIREGIAPRMDIEDRFWYGVAPAIAYVVLTLAGAAFAFEADVCVSLLAASMCLLLLAGIRNAWDMTTWVVLRRPS